MKAWIVELFIRENMIKVFTKKGCPPCEALKRNIEGMDNVEILDAIDYAIEYNLRQAPTTIIFKNGVEVQRFVGVKTKAEIEEILNSNPAN